MNGRASFTDGQAPRVGYVLTHYQKFAQTFIDGEIDLVRQAGIDITCFVMNSPEAGEARRPGRGESPDKIIYLKASMGRVVLALLATAVRHPLTLARSAAQAVRSSGYQPVRLARRLVHLAQATYIARQCELRGIQHLHAHFGLAPATLGWFAASLLRSRSRPCTFSFTIHGFHDFANAAEARLDLKARDADFIVCISDYTRSQLHMVTSPDSWDKQVVVRCGIDLDRFAMRPQRTLTDPRTVVSVGRLSPEKGILVTIEAIARLHRCGVPVRLRVIGDGPQRAELVAFAAAAGVAEAVTFVGGMEPCEVRAELASADVFCLASFNEGLPVSIMEAMATGIPVVTTWIAGIPELAIDGVTALSVAPARADHLADAIRRVIEDDALSARLATAARERVCARHDQRVTSAAMVALFTGRLCP